MINVFKSYVPLLLSPSETKQFVVEDKLLSAKFVFDPLIRVLNPSGGENCNLEINWIFDLGMGDDPLWNGSETIVVVNEVIPSGSFRDYVPSPQLDKDPNVPTRHVVKITNLSLTTTYTIKTIIYGLTEVSVQISNSQGVISTQRPI